MPLELGSVLGPDRSQPHAIAAHRRLRSACRRGATASGGLLPGLGHPTARAGHQALEKEKIRRAFDV